MWLTARERLTLAGLGAAALLGIGVLLWQRPPLAVPGSPTPAEAAHWTLALEQARQVDVNTAGAAELERLPGVGPKLAQRIVDHRRAHGRFRTAEELQEVRGIGPALYESLKDDVTTR